MRFQAKQTDYNDYRFRSRLEARWAVFFDTLGVQYRYEMQGFNLNGIGYLPDFYLPEYKYWIEIKGEEPTPRDQLKAALLCLCTQQDVIIFHDDVYQAKTRYRYEFYHWEVYNKVVEENKRAIGYFTDDICELLDACGGYNFPYGIINDKGFVVWENCWEWEWKQIDDEFEFYDIVPIGMPTWRYGPMCHVDEVDQILVYGAYRAARRARFEFGEHGR